MSKRLQQQATSARVQALRLSSELRQVRLSGEVTLSQLEEERRKCFRLEADAAMAAAAFSHEIRTLKANHATALRELADTHNTELQGIRNAALVALTFVGVLVAAMAAVLGGVV
ncbi:hypothetical protein HOU66_gp10 [Pectobacterium phage Arno160]|uniref:Uncharacterized protein n=1 Tax=Pectobacterium phage Arno160 TaxID=2488835 RepID=A0A3G8F4P5_9CAUD|nr:hypothetical protein HOU66_gp10 [Pectobacterium phage Arno160]AZF88072.1 hypothetical protein Arno160_gp10 [Pectobacterium phage Arno160]